MAFSNTIFLFVFLPVTLLLYYVSQRQYRNFILLAASVIFYACGEPRLVFLMLFSILCNYYFALAIEKYSYRKFFLVLSILYDLGVLFVFKYLGFSMSIFSALSGRNLPELKIALPIGISFYTFQTMSYVIDVYCKKVKAERNILDLALYISLFPQLVAGPIVRYHSIAGQLKSRTLSPELFGAGAKRFMCGFCKKVILANNLADVAQHYFNTPSTDNSVVGAWIGAVSFSLQIFYDFSGYSDMAIGLGKMLGFTFEENFNYPYISKSVTEFWRRWHISLSRWFRDYVYIPLGGSRVSVPRHIRNMAVVWLLTGLWHGANSTFIAWGAMYFAALVLEKYILKPQRWKNKIGIAVYRILVLVYVNFGWVLFNAQDLRAGIRYCLSMVGFHYGNALIDLQTVWMLREYGAFLLAGILFSTPLAPFLSRKLREKWPAVEKNATPFVYVLGFLWSVSFLVLGAHNPFIYSNF